MSFDRYKRDIENLVARGNRLAMAMIISVMSEEEKKKITLDKKTIKKLPDFTK